MGTTKVKIVSIWSASAFLIHQHLMRKIDANREN